MEFFSKPTSELDEEDLPAAFQDILKDVQEIIGLKVESKTKCEGQKKILLWAWKTCGKHALSKEHCKEP